MMVRTMMELAQKVFILCLLVFISNSSLWNEKISVKAIKIIEKNLTHLKTKKNPMHLRMKNNPRHLRMKTSILDLTNKIMYQSQRVIVADRFSFKLNHDY